MVILNLDVLEKYSIPSSVLSILVKAIVDRNGETLTCL